MLKIFICLLVLLPVLSGFSPGQSTRHDCDCLPIFNLEKTRQTTSIIAWVWEAPAGVSYYKIWYIRQEDSYLSDVVLSSSPATEFTNLTSGHYTFFFAAVCGEEPSGVIVTQDVNIG